MGFCSECGNNLGASTPKFCPECGTPCGNASKPAPVSAPARKAPAPKSTYKPQEVDLFAKNKPVKSQEFDGHYGLSAEVKKKLNDKYDPALENKARAYLQKKSGMPVNGNFAEALKSGEILCAAANGIRPGICKGVKSSKMPFIQMENIAKFIAACSTLGIRSNDSFMTIDLFEQKNMLQVVTCILALQIKYP